MATESRVAFILAAIASAILVFLSGYYLIHTVILFIRGSPDCTRPRSELDLGFAIFTFVLSLVGSIGVVWRLKPLQIICMVTLVITLLLILAVGMNILPGDQARYQLDKYPRWAKNFILNDNDWGVFQRCIIREKFCEKRDYKGGCCSPPIYCGYQETNKTWIVPKSGLYYQDDTNCALWSNDINKLCYNCDSCKAVYLNNFAEKWVFRGFSIIFAIIIWIGCYDCTVGAGNAENDRAAGRDEQTV